MKNIEIELKIPSTEIFGFIEYPKWDKKHECLNKNISFKKEQMFLIFDILDKCCIDGNRLKVGTVFLSVHKRKELHKIANPSKLSDQIACFFYERNLSYELMCLEAIYVGDLVPEPESY